MKYQMKYNAKKEYSPNFLIFKIFSKYFIFKIS
jgi:hypothetical protein